MPRLPLLEPLLRRHRAVPGLLVLPVAHDLLLVGAVPGGLSKAGQAAGGTAAALPVHGLVGQGAAPAAGHAAALRLQFVRVDGHFEGGGDVVSLRVPKILCLVFLSTK